MDEARVKEIFRLREEGKTYRQIVKELKMSSVTVGPIVPTSSWFTYGIYH